MKRVAWRELCGGSCLDDGTTSMFVEVAKKSEMEDGGKGRDLSNGIVNLNPQRHLGDLQLIDIHFYPNPEIS